MRQLDWILKKQFVEQLVRLLERLLVRQGQLGLLGLLELLGQLVSLEQLGLMYLDPKLGIGFMLELKLGLRLELKLGLRLELKLVLRLEPAEKLELKLL